jgi:hypothetical protein
MIGCCVHLSARGWESRDEPYTHAHRAVLSCGVHRLSWHGHNISGVEGFASPNCKRFHVGQRYSLPPLRPEPWILVGRQYMCHPTCFSRPVPLPQRKVGKCVDGALTAKQFVERIWSTIGWRVVDDKMSPRERKWEKCQATYGRTIISSFNIILCVYI